jgi:hypothetical protein
MNKTIIVDKSQMRKTPSGVMASMQQPSSTIIVEKFVKQPWENPIFEGYCGACEGFVQDPRGWEHPVFK